MKHRHHSALKWALRLSVAASACVSGVAFAQSEPSADEAAAEEAGSEGEIVVTGTLLRGVAPGGSQTIGISEQQITSVGASNTSQLLTTIPQAGFFLQQVVADARKSVNRPNLRNLGNTSSASPSTLVLIDGHRLPGMGVRQVSPDVDAIAPGAIQRIEIVTDGGSSLYGSDAVAGVLNFITKKSADGIDAQGRYGVGEDYDTWDASITAGHSWGPISAYVSYNYAWYESSGQRDYVQNLDWINGVQLTTTCDPGNITYTGVATIYALPTLTGGLGNRCDIGGLGRTQQDRHSVFASVVVDDGGPVSASLKGFYFNRKMEALGAPFSGSVSLNPLITAGANIGQPNPYYIPVPGRTGAQTIQFNTLSALERIPAITKAESWGFTPSVKFKLGGDWQLNALYNYGEGIASFNSFILNASLLQQLANQGRFNPANVAAAVNAPALQQVTDWRDYGWAHDTVHNMRAVVDGPLFDLPAGSVKAAVGAEMFIEDYKARILQGGTAATIAALPKKAASRNIKSLFGEINVPILSEDTGLFHAMNFSASGRYDKYSDVGSTFNPKFGLDLSPVEWLKLRANWGKSFQAPSLADNSVFTPPNLINLNAIRFNFGLTPLPGQITQVALQGVVDPLKPQKATTYSFGFDARPPILDGLSLGATYYRVKFKDQISITPWYLPNARDLFPGLISINPGPGNPAALAEFQARVNELAAISTNPQVLLSIPIGNIFSVVDGRNRNLSAVDVQGVDFNLNYRMETGFGDVFLNAAGNYIVKFKRQDFAGAAIRDTTGINESRFRLSTTLGTNIGDLLAQVRWSHQGGFDVTPSAANLQQSKVGDFNVIDFFFQYKVPGEGALKDLSLTLNIDNAFDLEPPLYRGNLGIEGAGPGYANGFTLGRIFKFGIQKQF